MKLPESAADAVPNNLKADLPSEHEAYIPNPYSGKPMLTCIEALNAINALSGMVLIDVNNRRHTTDAPEDKRHL